MKKKLFSFCILAYLLISLSVRAQIFQWAHSATGQNSFDNVYGRSTCTDANGYVYVTGSFGNSFTIFGTDTLNSYGYEDIFLVKYDQNGNVVWARSAGGSDDYDEGYSVTADTSGNIYITGRFTSTSITFSGITLNNSSPGFEEFFLAKYDNNGNILWAKNAIGSNNDMGYCVITDANNDVCVTGYFRNSIIFGSDTLINASANTDVFIVKYDPNGNVLWAKSAQGYNNDMGYGIATDANNNIYITGYFRSPSIIFDNDTLLNPDATNYEMFIAKYDSNGNLLWTKSAGGTGDDQGNGISTDFNGNVYITGSFESSITFGSTILTSIGYDDIFLVKYNSSGNFLWAKSAGGVSYDYGRKAVTDISGNIYLAGAFSNSAIIFGSTTLTNAGGYDIFITKYDSQGNVLWAKGAGGNGGDNCWGVAIDDCKNIYVAGPSSGTSITFDNITVTGGLGGGSMAYVAKLGYVPDVPICLVTVDSLSDYNIIVWNKPLNVPIDSFIIYRDIANNNWASIGVVSYDSLSLFIDTARSVGGPNGGDPNATSWRYKIAVMDTCGNVSEMSPYHQTIFIQNISGNFWWNHYEIEGQPIPVPELTNYLFQRDNISDGNWFSVATLSASSTAYTDPQYSTFQTTASWRAQTVWSISCTSTKAVSHNSTRSNVQKNFAVSVPLRTDNDLNLKIYPNPANTQLNVEFEITNYNKQILFTLFNCIGQKVLTEKTVQVQQGKVFKTLVLKTLNSGIYQFQILLDDGTTINKKVIIQK